MSSDIETKHDIEKLLYMNNYNNREDSSSSSDNDSSGEDEPGLAVKKKCRNDIKRLAFIHNNLTCARKRGGPNNNGQCPCCGRQTSDTKDYLPLNFECADVEDHPNMCRECAVSGRVCCLHGTKKVDNLDADDLLVDD